MNPRMGWNDGSLGSFIVSVMCWMDTTADSCREAFLEALANKLSTSIPIFGLRVSSKDPVGGSNSLKYARCVSNARGLDGAFRFIPRCPVLT